MIIACDVDGVVADLMPEWYRRYNREWNDNLTPDRVLGWHLHEWVKPECGTGVYKYLQDADLYEHILPIEGSVAGVERLRTAGHEVVFVTHSMRNMTDPKARWLIRHGFCKDGGRSLPADLVVAANKNFVAADLLIDDAGETIRKWVQSKRRRALLFEYPYNRYLLDEVPSVFWALCLRAANWREVIDRVSILGQGGRGCASFTHVTDS